MNGGLVPALFSDTVTPSAVPGLRFSQLRPRTAIKPARLDVAGFVGIAKRGPIDVPTRVTSWSAFVSTFGDHIDSGFLAHAVEGFFVNGGEVCWVVRVASLTARTAGSRAVDPRSTFRADIWATSPGSWGNEVIARFKPGAQNQITLEITDGSSNERWSGLDLSDVGTRRREAEDRLNDPVSGSRLVRVKFSPTGRPETPAETKLSSGSDGLRDLAVADYTGANAPDARGVRALEDVPEIGLLVAPDAFSAPTRETERREPACPDCQTSNPCSGHPHSGSNSPRSYFVIKERNEVPAFDTQQTAEIHRSLVNQATLLKDRFAILSLPSVEPTTALNASGGLTDLRNLGDGQRAAAYYPWLRVVDPLRPGQTVSVPPVGHVAGVFARTDAEIGPHRSPANIELRGILGPDHTIDDAAHGLFNDRCGNVIRSSPGRGTLVMGARTLHCREPWRYVAVRRLVTFVEESIRRSALPIVFEPANLQLRADLVRIVESFLDNLWRDGWLDGRSASDAFSVKCDDETMTGEDVDNGRLICEIGLQPPRPAEFVVVRIDLGPSLTLSVTEVARNG